MNKTLTALGVFDREYGFIFFVNLRFFVNILFHILVFVIQNLAVMH